MYSYPDILKSLFTAFVYFSIFLKWTNNKQKIFFMHIFLPYYNNLFNLIYLNWFICTK